jgi:glycine betaine/choline ABC-type transport system substrate-binding protein
MNRLRAVLGLFGFVLATWLVFFVLFRVIDLRDGGKDRVVIGSKADTEGILLAEIMALLIERRAGLAVDRRPALGGTQICFQALEAGAIDLYPEYTGTGLVAILEAPAIPDRARAYDHVAREFSRRWSLVWLEPMAFDNTYALAMARGVAERLAIRTISDLAKHPELDAGFTAEFMARQDGYPGLAKAYGFRFSREPRTLEAGLMYGAVDSGEVDIVSAYATDGRIDKMKLVVLLDDRRFFPPYQAAALVRGALLARHPKIRAALAPLAGRLNDAEMRRLNAAIDIDRRRPEEVAREVVDGLP